MIFYNFSEDALEVVNEAQCLAIKLGHSKVGTEHILLSIVENKGNSGSIILEILQVNHQELKQEIKRKIGYDWTKNSHRSIEYSRLTEKLFELAAEEAFISKSVIGTDHLIFGMANLNEGLAFEMLRKHQVNINRINKELKNNQNVDSIVINDIETPTLDALTDDLTLMAKQGQIDPLIGRSEEITSLIRTLMRRKKNNPVLLGDPGVGKTAIVEGLALSIVNNDVPNKLRNKRILSLNLGTLVAGTKYRGEFEEKLNNILNELKLNKNIILFIDEIHTLVGTGAAEGSLDAANILKPTLARGEILCIGATTNQEYKEYLEKDAALERRFQPIKVEEPSEDATLDILLGLKFKYESHHQVKVNSSSLKKAIEYSIKYSPERFLPDKAIDIIDETLADVYMLKGQGATVNELDIKRVVSRKTGVSINELADKDLEDIKLIEKNLYASFFYQEHVIDKVLRTLKRSFVGLRNANKPLASFLFYGEKNTGKNTFAKILTKNLYADKNRYLYIDFNKIPTSQLKLEIIGNTNGHLGFEKRGLVLRQIYKKPLSVIIFDNFDPLNTEIREIIDYFVNNNIIEDIQERKLDISNSIFITIMHTTSNNIGFSSSSQTEKDLLNNYLDDNFLSNFDSIINFNKLSDEQNIDILIRQIKNIELSLLNEGITLAIEECILEKAVEEYRRNKNLNAIGGRYEDIIRNTLADEFLHNQILKDKKLTISLSNNNYLIKGE